MPGTDVIVFDTVPGVFVQLAIFQDKNAAAAIE
jgi:hypothetical protein